MCVCFVYDSAFSRLCVIFVFLAEKKDKLKISATTKIQVIAITLTV